MRLPPQAQTDGGGTCFQRPTPSRPVVAGGPVLLHGMFLLASVAGVQTNGQEKSPRYTVGFFHLYFTNIF